MMSNTTELKMAVHIVADDDYRALWDRWMESRPEVIVDMVKQYNLRPEFVYRLHSSGRLGRIVSLEENGTLTMSIDHDLNPDDPLGLINERCVFDIRPDQISTILESEYKGIISTPQGDIIRHPEKTIFFGQSTVREKGSVFDEHSNQVILAAMAGGVVHKTIGASRYPSDSPDIFVEVDYDRVALEEVAKKYPPSYSVILPHSHNYHLLFVHPRCSVMSAIERSEVIRGIFRQNVNKLTIPSSKLI